MSQLMDDMKIKTWHRNMELDPKTAQWRREAEVTLSLNPHPGLAMTKVRVIHNDATVRSVDDLSGRLTNYLSRNDSR